MYKLYKSQSRPDVTGVLLIEPGRLISIPFNEANADYQQYLAWLAEGNQPLPADEE